MAMLTPADFIFRDKFVADLTDAQIQNSFDVVETMFSGLWSLWRFLPAETRKKKQVLAFNFLCAWWLVDNYPDLAIDTSGNGGAVLDSKSIGGVSVSFRRLIQNSESLSALESNAWGVKALMMLQGVPELWTIVAKHNGVQD